MQSSNSDLRYSWGLKGLLGITGNQGRWDFLRFLHKDQSYIILLVLWSGHRGDPNMILNGAGGFLWITAILITALWSVCWRTYPLPFAPKITQYFPTVVLLCYESDVLCVPLIPMMGHFSRPGDGFGAHTLWTLVHRRQPLWSRNVTVLIFSQNYHL